ncbi:hypothetical protein [Pedobacter africanus]|uniref:Uncharacterized protein n=1 Tax=Pedobacter africanus TaxID=151894 RepID=A0A1W2CTQ4_9SPHI|nr:hypothetical protein [Pedobacter africanus]SMC88635.1 hypothetical protein SAMN04488524_3211 [Pedobacter africanus]
MKIINQIFMTVVTVVVMYQVSLGQEKTPVKDFNAKWQLDADKTDFGDLPKQYVPTFLALTQTKDAFTIERKFVDLAEPTKQTLTLDGKPQESKDEGQEIVRTLALSENKKVLTVNTKIHVIPNDQDPFDITRIETYVLAEDGMTLMLTRTSIMPDGAKQTAKALYNKLK